MKAINFNIRNLFILLLSFFTLGLNGQEVTVSRDISIRNDFAYHILGQIEDYILLYRDKGLDHKVIAFDTSLQFRWEQDVWFEEKKVRVHGITPQDSSFNIYFSFKKKGKEYFKVNQYNARTELIDSSTIILNEESSLTNLIDFEESKNKSKTLLYYIKDRTILGVFAIDNDSLKVSWSDQFEFDKTNLNKDFVDIEITNEGNVLMLLEKNNSNMGKDEHIAELVLLTPDLRTGKISLFDLTNKLSLDIGLFYDNFHNQASILGLYTNKRNSQAEGYFQTNLRLYEIGEDKGLSFYRFDENILKELYGRSANKFRGLNHFRIGNVVPRVDGGMLLVLEMQREFSRRSNYSTPARATVDYYGMRGWTDYYNEDMVVLSLDKDGGELWNKVFYKKQFSQDDGGIFSSFFLFKTPSRIRLIFNDEIRNNNTVSEYIFDPIGNYKRESLLSTEYQKLRLRFKDAFQLSSSEILVPSERNYNLNLVKIKYL